MSGMQKQTSVGNLLRILRNGEVKVQHRQETKFDPDAGEEEASIVLESLLQLELNEVVSYASDPATNWRRMNCQLKDNGELRCVSETREHELVFKVCYASSVTRRDEIRYDRYKVFKLLTTEGILFFSCSTPAVAKRWIAAVRSLCTGGDNGGNGNGNGNEKVLDGALDRLDPHYHHQLTLEAMASSTLLAKFNNVRVPKAVLPRTKLSNSMEGWLERYSQNRWTRSYFVLEDNVLFRFVHRNKLFIPCEAISVHQAHTAIIAPDQDDNYVFKILTPRVQLTLKSKYKGAMVAWIMRLNPDMYDTVSHDIRLRESTVKLKTVQDLFNYSELRQAFQWFMERTHAERLVLFDFASYLHSLYAHEGDKDFDAQAWKLFEDYVEDTGEKAITAMSTIHDEVEPLASEGNWIDCFDKCQAVIDEQLNAALATFKESPEFNHALPNYSDCVVYGPKLLVVQQDGEEDVVVPLHQGTLTIGRSENADMMIHSTALSRLHCIVHVTDDDYVVAIDNNTSTGIHVDGVRLSRYYMRWDDEVKVGKKTVIQLVQQW